MVAQERRGLHQHPGGAVAALKRAVIDKCLLQWMQFPITGKPLNRDDILARYILERCHARTHGFATNGHGTSAAESFTTSVLGSGERQISAQDPQQQALVVGIECDGVPIQNKVNRFFHMDYHQARIWGSLRALALASLRGLPTMMGAMAIMSAGMPSSCFTSGRLSALAAEPMTQVPRPIACAISIRFSAASQQSACTKCPVALAQMTTKVP